MDRTTWTHAILEIYEPDSGWPVAGTPASWIVDQSVGWCDGREEDLVQFIPLWRIMWWKVKHGLIDIKDHLVYLLGFINGRNKRLEKQFEEMMARHGTRDSKGDESGH